MINLNRYKIMRSLFRFLFFLFFASNVSAYDVPNILNSRLLDEVEKNWENGKHVIFDIDVVGGINIKKLFPERTLAIFVKPPSIKVLEERLTNRGGNSQEDIKKRVQKAIKEMEYSSDFDKIILNDELEESKRIAFDYVNNFLNQ